MTIAELIAELQKHEPEREVFVSLEVDNDLFDAEALSVSMMAGHVFISGAES